MPNTLEIQLSAALWSRGLTAQPQTLRDALQVEFYSRQNNKDQARVPKGSEAGGQFAKQTGATGHGEETGLPSDAKEGIHIVPAIAKKCRNFLEGPPVVSLQGNEIPHFTKIQSLRRWLGDWFRDKWQNKAINPVLGEVRLDWHDAKTSASHGMGPLKEQAFAAVHAIIEKGQIAYHAEKGGMDSFFLIAPIKIAGEAYAGVAIVRRDTNLQRFYLHEVDALKKLQASAINTGAPAEASKRADADLGAIRSVLANIFSVKKEGEQQQKEQYSLAAAFRLEYARRYPERYRWNAPPVDFKEDKHPRQGKGRNNGGQFAPKGGGGGGSTAATPPDPFGSTVITTEAAINQAHTAPTRSATVAIDGHQVEVTKSGSQWLSRPAGVPWATWQPLDDKAAKHVKEQLTQQKAAKAKQTHEAHKKTIVDALTARGPINGNKLWKSMGIEKDDFLDAYFALAESGQIHQNMKNGILALGPQPEAVPKQRKPRQPAKPRRAAPTPPPPPQHAIVQAPKRTPEEEAAEAKARQEAEAAAIARQLASKLEAQRAEREENTKRLTQTAEDYGISPDDLLDAAKWIVDQKRTESDEREAAKTHARQMTRLTAMDIQRIENSGKDYTGAGSIVGVTGEKLRGFDEKAQEFARHHHGMIGDADDPNADFSRGLWDLLREGRLEAPAPYDSDILNEAAAYVSAAGKSEGREPGIDDLDDPWGELQEVGDREDIPFRKAGSPERYARYRRWLLTRHTIPTQEPVKMDMLTEFRYQSNVVRYARLMREAYGKVSRGQQSFTWTDEDEQKHPRDNDGKFAEKAAGPSAKPTAVASTAKVTNAAISHEEQTAYDAYAQMMREHKIPVRSIEDWVKPRRERLKSKDEAKPAEPEAVEKPTEDTQESGDPLRVAGNTKPEDDPDAVDQDETPIPGSLFDDDGEGDDTPNQAAAKATERQKDADYAYARASKVRNSGEDIMGSARHKANAWRGLAEAEADGTAEQMVTREMLLKHEPHALMVHVGKNPLTSLAMYYVMRNFPAKPEYGRITKDGTADPKKTRAQFVEAYRNIKAKAEELAANENDSLNAMVAMRVFMGQEISRLRGQASDGVQCKTGGVADPYNPIANALIRPYNGLKIWGRGAIKGQLESFAKAYHEKYADDNAKLSLRTGEIPEHVLDQLARHVGDIMEGASLPKTFGQGKKETSPRFNPAAAYVQSARREGGKKIDAGTAEKATEYMRKKIGLRAVQFGNYVPDVEREHHAKKCAEALADLADVLDIPEEMVSWRGQLGVAIGARGHGNALAHYETSNIAINLTRASGAGSLAHEWGHLFDHMIGNAAGKMWGTEDFVHSVAMRRKAGAGQVKVSNQEAFDRLYPPIPDQMAPLVEKIDDVSKAMEKSGYTKRLRTVLNGYVRAGLMSEKKAREYWESGKEKWARCFERHVQRKLEREGRANTYLAGLEEKSYKTGGPWPTDEEADAMSDSFDAVFSELKDGIEKKRYAMVLEDGRPKLRFCMPPLRADVARVMERYRRNAEREEARLSVEFAIGGMFRPS